MTITRDTSDPRPSALAALVRTVRRIADNLARHWFAPVSIPVRAHWATIAPEDALRRWDTM